MRYISIKEAKLLDKKAQEIFKIPPLILMENAGLRVAEEVLEIINLKFKKKRKRIAIICGVGNNGGDGLVCARHLLSRGLKLDVFLLGEISEVKEGPARENLEILINLGQKIYPLDSRNLFWFKKKIFSYSLIVDAIFGIGLNKNPEGVFAEVIKIINQSGVYVVAIDVPSGLNANTGKPQGICIKAKTTITFVAPKIGFSKPWAQKYVGRIVVKDLGFPYD